MKQRETGDLGPLLESFFRKCLLAERRASPATVAAYRDALKLLLVYSASRLRRPPSRLAARDMERDVVLGFLDHLETVRGNTIRTRNARLAAIHSFFHHVAFIEPSLLGAAQRILAIQPRRTEKRIVTHLAMRELAALLDAPDRATVQGRRDYALLLFMAETGARVSEAIGVNAAHVRLDRPWQVTLFGKGSKERILPLREETARTLKELQRERGIGKEAALPLFTNNRGERLTRFGVSHLVRRAVVKARRELPGFTKVSVSPHVLRHTAAMNLLRSKVDVTVIRSWLGHVSLETTHQYMEADVEMKRSALEASSSVSRKRGRFKPSDPLLAQLESL